MPALRRNEVAARRCVELFNQRRPREWVEACYAEKAEWMELPLPSTPNGRCGGREALQAAAEQVLRLIPNRQMQIRNLVVDEDQVALEIDWEGTAAATVGGLAAGSTVRFRVATFLTFVDGLIVRQTDYCVPLRPEGPRS